MSITSPPHSSSPAGVIPVPPGGDGTHQNFWRCKQCTRVNFRTDMLCAGCRSPSGAATGGNDNHFVPATLGHLRSQAAVAVNAKISNLQQVLEEQRKKQERDIAHLRSQVEIAMQSHNNLIAVHRSAALSAKSGEISSMETGYQQQIVNLQQEVVRERDDAQAEVLALKRKLAETASPEENASFSL